MSVCLSFTANPEDTSQAFWGPFAPFITLNAQLEVINSSLSVLLIFHEDVPVLTG